MRGLLPIYALALCVGACIKETPNIDARTGNHPPPRVIAGGGIGDGAIDGVVNLYVIDDDTRLPIANATVRVGAVSGLTDASGLFVARDVSGPQTVIAKATGYRSELWIGANGANLTLDLQPAVRPPPGRADLSGQIAQYGDVTVVAGHTRIATIAYSQSDDLGDAANNLKTAGDANTCIGATGPCTFKVTVRTGRVGLIAAIFDRDLKGTADPGDDTMTLVRWAYRSGITVTDGVNQSGQDLTLIDPLSAGPATIEFGAPPPSLSSVAGLIGLDAGGDGVYQLPVLRTPAEATLAVPRLAALGATGYRLTAIAQDGASSTATQSVVLRRGLTGSTLAVGAWLAPPASVTVTRTTAAWSAVPGATVTGIEYTQGSATVTHLLSATVFDGSTSLTIPDLVALPVTGIIDAKLSAIGATGLDVSSFGLDADRTKLDRVAAQPVTLSN